jgi:hypothetical protein
VSPKANLETNKELISMAMIEISNLNAAGSDLFAGNESFLNELQATEANDIVGGSGGKKNSKNKGGNNYGGGNYGYPVYIPFPVYTGGGYPGGGYPGGGYPGGGYPGGGYPGGGYPGGGGSCYTAD